MKLRKLHFQLTPLLDLLLIVIFAQYLDVQESSARESQELRAEYQQEREELLGDVRAAREELTVRERTALVMEGELDRRAAELDAQAERLAEFKEDLEEQQDTAGEILAKLFDVSEEVIAEVFQSRKPPRVPQTQAEVAELKEQLEEMASGRGREVLDFLLTYEELRKRADIWGVHVSENGEIRLQAGDWSNTIRATSADEFAEKFFTNYKTLPQPKNLVIILVSYGDARADVRSAVLNGLPTAVKEMRDDRLGRTQFEYAVLGFVPGRGPVIP